MDKGCTDDLVRVRQYDSFLAQMDLRRSWPPHPDKVMVGDSTPVELVERSNTSTPILIGSCCSGDNSSTWPLGASNACSGTGVSSHSKGQYIIEGRHGPVVKYKSLNNQGTTKIRNDRFQRFVAAKQHRRERTLKSSGRISTTCEEGNSITEANNRDIEEISTPVYQQNNYAGREDSLLGNSHDVAPTPETESSCSFDMEQDDDIPRQDVSSLHHPLTRCDDSPTSVAEISGTQYFMDSSYDTKSPPLLDYHAMKRQQKYLFVRVESNLNRKSAMKQPGRHTNRSLEKQSNKLTWWDDDANKHKCSNLKSDASCDAAEEVGCFCCIDRIRELSLECTTDVDSYGENRPNETTLMDLLQGEEPGIVDDFLSDCTSIHEWWDTTLRMLFGSKSGKKVSSMQKGEAKNKLHLDCFSLEVDDGTLERNVKAFPNANDDASLFDSEATPPTSNTSCCGSSIVLD